MDNNLLVALSGSYSPDQQQREQAEALLGKAEQTPGYLRALISIWVNQAADAQIRQAAAIQAKNAIRKHWSRAINYDGTLVEGPLGTAGYYEIPEDEKTFVKDSMIEVLVRCTDQANLRAQALEIVKLTVSREYPCRWPTFLSQCLTLVSSGDETKMYCGLACVRLIAREFEMKSSDTGRGPMEDLIQVAMPGLLSLAEQLSKTADQVVSATLLKFILKIFYSVIQAKLSKHLADQSVCTRWFELCSNLCRVMPSDPNADMEEGVHAKLHKWSFRILSRFFAKYGNPEIVEAEDSKEFDLQKFSTWWLGMFAPPLVALVSESVKNPKMSKAAKYQALSFLSESIQHSVTYKALKPFLQTLLFEVIFPLMCFNAEDNELWESDPEEYIRREFDCMVAFSDPRTAAVEFLKNMVSMRSKDSLAPLLKFCESHLSCDASDVAKFTRKDGALAIIGSIAPQLCVACKKSKKKKPSVSESAANRLPDKGQLEAMLGQFVLPDFASPVGFLRYRACWVYQQFADEQFPFGNPTTTQAAFAGYRSCLSDKELPVRVQAGCSVKSFIMHEDLAPLIRAFVPELLDKLLKLMHEVDCEPLASTLESLVSEYSEEVLPFAAQAIEQLAKVFVRLMDAPEDDDDAQLACMGSIQTICTIMESASSTPEMYAKIEPACYAVLNKIFSPDGVDFLEEGLDILTYLTFYCPEPLSKNLWVYFDLMHQSVVGGQLAGFPTVTGSSANGWAVDYAENMLNVFDNFISRSTREFVSGSGLCGRPYLQMLLEVCARCLENDSEITQVAGAKIAACVFESCPKSSVDGWVKPFVQLGWSKFSAESCALNRWLFYLFTMALYYDPIVTAKTVEGLGTAGDFFAAFSKLGKFAKSKDERKAYCLALCGLIRRMGEAGAVAQSHMKAYVEILAVQSKEIAEQRQKQREAAAEAGGSSEEEEDDDDDYEDEIDLQDLDEGESADQSAKLRMTNRLRDEIALIKQQIGLGDDFDDDDEDDSDYYDEDDDDCERVSPLDAFNEFSTIKETLTGLGATTLLGWFGQNDLINWNALLDENIKLDTAAAATAAK